MPYRRGEKSIDYKKDSQYEVAPKNDKKLTIETMKSKNSQNKISNKDTKIRNKIGTDKEVGINEIGTNENRLPGLSQTFPTRHEGFFNQKLMPTRSSIQQSAPNMNHLCLACDPNQPGTKFCQNFGTYYTYYTEEDTDEQVYISEEMKKIAMGADEFEDIYNQRIQIQI